MDKAIKDLAKAAKKIVPVDTGYFKKKQLGNVTDENNYHGDNRAIMNCAIAIKMYEKEAQVTADLRIQLREAEHHLQILVDENMRNIGSDGQFACCFSHDGTPKYWQDVIDFLDNEGVE